MFGVYKLFHVQRMECVMKAIPVQAYIGPRAPGGLNLPGFSDYRHTKVAKFSAWRNGRLYSRGKTAGTHSS